MTTRLHTLACLSAFCLLLAGCSKQPDNAPVVSDGMARVYIDVNVGGFAGFDQCPQTKADFVAVDENYRFATEQIIDNMVVYLFDASDAYMTDAGGKLAFVPSAAMLLEDAVVLASDQIATVGNVRRIELHAPSTVTSLAVLVLANLDTPANYTTGTKGTSSMMAVVNTLTASKLMAYDAGSAYGTSVGIPMCGWKLFGSLVGETNLDAAKEEKGLKFYKGMSTPLTETGFSSSSALNAYVSKGFVADKDMLPLQRRLSRIHLYFTSATGHKEMTIQSAQLTGYRSKICLIPNGIFGTGLTPFDAVSDAGNVVMNNPLNFREVSTGHRVVYVPEFNVAAVAGDADKEPYLTLEAKENGTDRTYTYTKDKVTVSGTGTGLPREYHYDMPWLHFKTLVTKKDKDNNDVPAGTYFNLIGNYTYEWTARGVEE